MYRSLLEAAQLCIKWRILCISVDFAGMQDCHYDVIALFGRLVGVFVKWSTGGPMH